MAGLSETTPHRILIIDDSTSSRDVLVKGLHGLGYTIAGEANDAGRGLRLVRTVKPDLAFIAIGLPDTDGITLAGQIMDQFPIPIVILSRHRKAEAIRHATEIGVMNYLIKPLREEELQPAIELAIGRFREFMAVRKENADLKRALEERKIIERAKGILMEREGLAEGEAFARIRKASMKSRKPMVEIAHALLTAAEVSKANENHRGG